MTAGGAPATSTLPTAATIGEWIVDARRRTFELVADLDDTQLRGPRLPIVNRSSGRADTSPGSRRSGR